MNTLYYGDNLPILRQYVADESVDLVYLDPPFNSSRTYNVLFKQESGVEAEAQIAAFEDTWHWNTATEATYRHLLANAPANVAQMLDALRGFIGQNQMMAYLVMMAARLVELRRALKPTGSLYLHCDPTASHYLPFCGCGTTIAAAQKLGRRWIGIDVTHLSIALQKHRLRQMFGDDVAFRVVGEPEDEAGARQLAHDDRYQFQWWALSLIRARPFGGEAGGKTGKKGANRGIDGVIHFVDDATGKLKRVVVQVKSGRVGSPAVRDLVGVVNREEAAIGVFLTLEEPTREMRAEAAVAGFYHSPLWNRDYPRLQIVTVKELLSGTARVEMPPWEQTFQQAPRVKDRGGEQPRLLE